MNDRNDNRELRPISKRIFVSNLNAEFTNYELQQIFSKVGDLKKCGIHWDQLGNSRRTAEIEYLNVEAALEAVKQFHGKYLS